VSQSRQGYPTDAVLQYLGHRSIDDIKEHSLRPYDAQGEEGKAIDLDGEALALIGQGAVAPRVAEEEGHRGLLDLQDGVVHHHDARADADLEARGVLEILERVV